MRNSYFKSLAFLLMVLPALLVSCASHKKETQDPDTYEKNISKNMQNALDAQRQALVQKNDSQIIGSAEIISPDKHKNDAWYFPTYFFNL